MQNTMPSGAKEILAGRFIASLGTQNEDGSIHLTAVWYLFEGGCLCVATSSRSRKARNVLSRRRASLMVDIRKPASERGLVAIYVHSRRNRRRKLKRNQCSHPPSLHERGSIGRSPRRRHDGRNGRHHTEADTHGLVYMGHAYARRRLIPGSMKTPGYLLPLDQGCTDAPPL